MKPSASIYITQIPPLTYSIIKEKLHCSGNRVSGNRVIVRLTVCHFLEFIFLLVIMDQPEVSVRAWSNYRFKKIYISFRIWKFWVFSLLGKPRSWIWNYCCCGSLSLKWRQLIENLRMTLKWLCYDSIMTLGWLAINFVITLGWNIWFGKTLG